MQFRVLIGIALALAIGDAQAADAPSPTRIPCDQSAGVQIFDQYDIPLIQKPGIECTVSTKPNSMHFTLWRSDNFQAAFLDDSTYNNGMRLSGKGFYRMYVGLYSMALNPEKTHQAQKEFEAAREFTHKSNDQYGIATGNGQVVFYSHKPDAADSTGDKRPMNGNIFVMKEADINSDKPAHLLNVSCQCTLQEMFDYLVFPAVRSSGPK